MAYTLKQPCLVCGIGCIEGEMVCAEHHDFVVRPRVGLPAGEWLRDASGVLRWIPGARSAGARREPVRGRATAAPLPPSTDTVDPLEGFVWVDPGEKLRAARAANPLRKL